MEHSVPQTAAASQPAQAAGRTVEAFRGRLRWFLSTPGARRSKKRTKTVIYDKSFPHRGSLERKNLAAQCVAPATGLWLNWLRQRIVPVSSKGVFHEQVCTFGR